MYMHSSVIPHRFRVTNSYAMPICIIQKLAKHRHGWRQASSAQFMALFVLCICKVKYDSTRCHRGSAYCSSMVRGMLGTGTTPMNSSITLEFLAHYALVAPSVQTSVECCPWRVPWPLTAIKVSGLCTCHAFNTQQRLPNSAVYKPMVCVSTGHTCHGSPLNHDHCESEVSSCHPHLSLMYAGSIDHCAHPTP